MDAVILTKSFRMNYGDTDQGISDIEDLDVPVLRAIRLYYQTPEQWKNASSIEPTELYFQIAQPEMDGVIEPIVISGRNETAGDRARELVDSLPAVVRWVPW